MDKNKKIRKTLNAVYIIFGGLLLAGVFMRTNDMELWYYPHYIGIAGGIIALVTEVSLSRRKLETDKHENS